MCQRWQTDCNARAFLCMDWFRNTEAVLSRWSASECIPVTRQSSHQCLCEPDSAVTCPLVLLTPQPAFFWLPQTLLHPQKCEHLPLSALSAPATMIQAFPNKEYQTQFFWYGLEEMRSAFSNCLKLKGVGVGARARARPIKLGWRDLWHAISSCI